MITLDQATDAVYDNIVNTKVFNTIDILSESFGINIYYNEDEDSIILNDKYINDDEFDAFVTEWFDNLPKDSIVAFFGEMENCKFELTEDGENLIQV